MFGKLDLFYVLCARLKNKEMIEKSEMEYLIRTGLLKVLTTDTFYHYTKYKVGIDDILIDNTLQFSNPKVFNDPFDCNERLLKIESNEKDVDDTISNLFLKPSRQKRREIKRKFYDPIRIQEVIKKERNRYKLACFSEFSNETLMWSHYADKHSGICIGFDFPHKYEDKFILCPVKYLDVLKSIDGMTDVYRVIIYWLTTKSIRWEYEHEIRAITKCKTSENHELVKFDPKYIKEIIFGCNVTDKEVKEGINKIRKSGLNLDRITIKRMRIDENNFLLKEEIIKPSP